MLLTENRFLVVFTFVGIKRSLSMLSLRGNLVPHIFSFLGGRFENFNKTKFVLSLLSSLPPRPATLIVLLALGPHDEPLQFDCIAIRLFNFLTYAEPQGDARSMLHFNSPSKTSNFAW